FSPVCFPACRSLIGEMSVPHPGPWAECQLCFVDLSQRLGVLGLQKFKLIGIKDRLTVAGVKRLIKSEPDMSLKHSAADFNRHDTAIGDVGGGPKFDGFLIFRYHIERISFHIFFRPFYWLTVNRKNLTGIGLLC